MASDNKILERISYASKIILLFKNAIIFVPLQTKSIQTMSLPILNIKYVNLHIADKTYNQQSEKCPGR